MTSSTETSTLRLVRVLPSYSRGLMARGMTANVDGRPEDDDARVFFGTDDGPHGTNYVCLVVPDEDPRSEGMWEITSADRTRYGVPDDGKTYRGWNVEKRHAEFLPDAPDPLAGLVPGAWFTWGSRSLWYRVASFDGDTLTYDRYAYGDGGRTVPTGDPITSTNTFTRAQVQSWLTRDGGPRESAVIAPPATSETPQETPQDASSGPSEESAEAAYLRGKREAEEVASRRFEEWKERAVRIAHQYADDNELCGQFDRCMEDIGLPTRTRSVQVRVTFNVETGRGETDREGIARAISNATGVDSGTLYDLLHPGNADVYVTDDDGDEINEW